MPASSRASVLCGLGSWIPPDIVTNDDLAQILDTSDEWIRKRIGVRQRHVASPGMATSELAVEAGSRALKSARLESVDALIIATSTPDRPCPATAPDVASRLGLGMIPAFDVAAVCTGFIYALASAVGMIAKNFRKHGGLVGYPPTIAGISARPLGDDAHTDGMCIAACKQTSARRRAH